MYKRQFKEFCGDNILVAHNAHSFDMLFIRKAGEKAGVSWDENTYIDTLPMGQALFPGLRNYKLDTINKHLEIPPFNHHRAVDDAMALARIFEVMLTDLEEKDIHAVEAINTGLGGNKEVLKKKYYHLIILVQNQVGLKNLYRIVSAAHTQYFFKKPRVPRSLLNQYREGLLLSPACEAGELYRAIVAGQPYEQLLRIADYMMDNVSNITSARNITDILNADGLKITNKTVGTYMGYLCDAFAFYKVRRYDIRGKKYLKSGEKYYLADHAFKYALLGTRDMDWGRVYENMVAIELLRRGYEVYVGVLYKKEIDFVAIKRSEKLYIQVSDDISSDKTFEREISPLLSIGDAYPKMILARTHHEATDRNGVQIVDLARWLCDEA